MPPVSVPMSSDSLQELKNLGPASIRMLQAAGIKTAADLRRLGSVGAFLAVREVGQRPTMNLLWALEGALREEHWAKLSEKVRAKVLKEIDRHKSDS
jgi:DNA transformation protein